MPICFGYSKLRPPYCLEMNRLAILNKMKLDCRCGLTALTFFTREGRIEFAYLRRR